MKKIIRLGLLLILLAVFPSCDKGYQVRFTNYSTESMDSVSVGDNKILFTNVDRQTATKYVKIKAGDYPIICISHSKKHYQSSISIAKSGNGKRSIQIDGSGAIAILED